MANLYYNDRLIIAFATQNQSDKQWTAGAVRLEWDSVNAGRLLLRSNCNALDKSRQNRQYKIVDQSAVAEKVYCHEL